MGYDGTVSNIAFASRVVEISRFVALLLMQRPIVERDMLPGAVVLLSDRAHP